MNELLAPELASAFASPGWRDGPGPPLRHRRILRSSASMAAFAYASGWAQRNGAALVVVHVDNGVTTSLLESVCALVGITFPGMPPPDLSSDVRTAMLHVSAPWT